MAELTGAIDRDSRLGEAGHGMNRRGEKRERRQVAKEARQAERELEACTLRFRRLAARGARLFVVIALVGALGWWVFRAKPGTYVASQGNAHIAGQAVGFKFASDPPTSGPHLASHASWGIHEQPIPKALQVHSLEDGGVLVQYNCTDCDDLIRNLKDIVRRYSDKAILAPYPGMKTRIALTAWSYRDAFDEFDEGRILRFIGAHRGIDHHVRGGFAN
jgi:hypothetical protein